MIDEGNTWVQFGFIPTPSVEKLLNSSRQILILFGNVQDLIMTYNRIVTSMNGCLKLQCNLSNIHLFHMRIVFQLSVRTNIPYFRHL